MDLMARGHRRIMFPGLAFAPNPVAGAPNAFTAEDFNGSTATFALRYAF